MVVITFFTAYLIYCGVCSTAAAGVAIKTCYDNSCERYERKQKEKKEKKKYKSWHPKKSVTKTSSDDIKLFLLWFQSNSFWANNKMHDITNIADLPGPVMIPTLGKPFKCLGTVITLGKYENSYVVTIAADSDNDINYIWDKITTCKQKQN